MEVRGDTDVTIVRDIYVQGRGYLRVCISLVKRACFELCVCGCVCVSVTLGLNARRHNTVGRTHNTQHI